MVTSTGTGVAVALSVLVGGSSVLVAILVTVGVAVADVAVKKPSTVVTGSACAPGLARMACVMGKAVSPLASMVSVYEMLRLVPVPGAMVRLLKL